MNDSAFKAWLESQGFTSSNGPLRHMLSARNARGITPLMHAARLGRIGYIGELLSRGADPRAIDADGNGALWFACLSGRASCVNALLKAGAAPDTRNADGETALSQAAATGKTAIVRLMLDAGADPAGAAPPPVAYQAAA